MLATLTAPVRSAPTTQAKVFTDPSRSPEAVASEIAALQPEAERAYAGDITKATAASVRRVDKLCEELVASVIRERPALGARAQYDARLAEVSHQAFVSGEIPLETRNRLATRAADSRALVMGHAQAYLDATRGGYLAQGSVLELHHVAV